MEEEKIKVPISWDIDGPDKAEVGDLVTFNLAAKDASGNPYDIKPSGLGMFLSVQDRLRGSCEEEGKKRKTGVGSFAFDFVPQILGTHQLRIQMGPQVLFKNQSISLIVQKEVTDETLNYRFELEGKGLLSARLDESLDLNLSVFEKDAPTDIDTSKLSVKVTGNGRTFLAKVTRRGVGLYKGTFTASTPGIYSASVIYDSIKVLKQRIQFYEHTSARCSTIDNIPSSVNAGSPVSLSIQSIDMHGNPTGLGGDPWSVTISEGPVPASSVPLKIVDHLNGKYSLNFTLGKRGTYKVEIKLKDENIKKSPFKIKAE